MPYLVVTDPHRDRGRNQGRGANPCLQKVRGRGCGRPMFLCSTAESSAGLQDCCSRRRLVKPGIASDDKPPTGTDRAGDSVRQA